ncbi:MAG: hypothetical protein AB7J13_15870, partial [Pyrinomonadaceae bacterium]
IHWLSESEGGRLSPPRGSRYVTVARFLDEKEKYPKEAWSLVVENIDVLGSDGPSMADVRFLVDDAPDYLLHEGSLFELFEGRKMVAKGKILISD